MRDRLLDRRCDEADGLTEDLRNYILELENENDDLQEQVKQLARENQDLQERLEDEGQ